MGKLPNYLDFLPFLQPSQTTATRVRINFGSLGSLTLSCREISSQEATEFSYLSKENLINQNNNRQVLTTHIDPFENIFIS